MIHGRGEMRNTVLLNTEYKLQRGNEFIRALARFAAARERRDFDYALAAAKAIPCEPLVQVLTSVLSEDRR